MAPRLRGEPEEIIEVEAPEVEPSGLTYRRLDDSQRRQILEQRLVQLEAEYYQHDVNRKLAATHFGTANDAEARGQARVAKHAQVIIEDAHATVLAEIELLEDE